MSMLPKDELDKDLHNIASEIEGFLLSGKVRAVAAIICTEDGFAHTRVRYLENGRMPLLAGITLMQHDVVTDIQRDPNGKNDR